MDSHENDRTYLLHIFTETKEKLEFAVTSFLT